MTDGLEHGAYLFLESGGLADFEVVGDLSSCLVPLFLAVLEEDGKVVVEGLKDSDIKGILRDIAYLDRINGLKYYFFRFDRHVDWKIIDFYILFGDMKNGLRMDVLQDLSLLIDTNVDCVDEIAILDSHDLVLEVHEDDLFRVILDTELSLDIVHDIVNSIGLSGLDLFSLKVDLKAP